MEVPHDGSGQSRQGAGETCENAKKWALRRPVLDAHIFALENKIQKIEEEIDTIMMQKLSTL